MTLSFYCKVCQFGYLIVGTPEELAGVSRLLESGSYDKCITPWCQGSLEKVPTFPVEVRDIIELPIRSFYRAIHGFGSGEGDPAAADEFERLLKSKRIVGMTITAVGQPERVIMHQLVLDDGTRMHFDSSARGACCYYIEKPGKTCVEVVENELSVDETVVSSVGEDREETGRVYEDAEGAESRLQFPADAISTATGTEPMQPVWVNTKVSKDRDAG